MQDEKIMRMRSLDSIRGIAALVVLIHHCVQYIPSLEHSSIAVHIFNGSGAVLIFFVLSGLVLAMSCVKQGSDAYAPFIIKRFFRIWPPFAIAILVSALLRVLVGHHPIPGTTVSYSQNAESPVTLASLLAHLAMLGTTENLDTPMWSLVHEIRISLIFPALVILTLRSWQTALAASMMFCMASSWLHIADPVIASLIITTKFMFLFVLGIIITLKRKYLEDRIDKLSSIGRAMLWIGSILGVLASPDFSTKNWDFTTNTRLLLDGFAAAGLILLCATSNRSERWLSKGAPVYLGNISYSLYLWHVVVLTYFIQAFHGLLPLPLMILVGAALSVLASDVSQHMIERPSTRFGRRLAGSIDH